MLLHTWCYNIRISFYADFFINLFIPINIRPLVHKYVRENKTLYIRDSNFLAFIYPHLFPNGR